MKAWKERKIEEFIKRSLTYLCLKMRYKKKSSASITKAKKKNNPKRRDILTFHCRNSPKPAITFSIRWRINNLLRNQIYQNLSFQEKYVKNQVLVTTNQYKVSKVVVGKVPFTMRKCQPNHLLNFERVHSKKWVKW